LAVGDKVTVFVPVPAFLAAAELVLALLAVVLGPAGVLAPPAVFGMKAFVAASR
jgi:hypothetical protein